MAPDPRINATEVLAVIYDPKHQRRRIWTPSTTLSVMGIDFYPHVPKIHYHKMKQVLAELCELGKLQRRERLHSRWTMNERAYSWKA